MPDSAEQVYGTQIHEGLGGYRGVWTPDTPIHVGDIGVLNGSVIQPQGSLSSQGIEFEIQLDDAAAEIHWTSSTGVDLAVKAVGETSAALPNVPKGEAGIGISFSQAGRAVMHLQDTHQPRIKDILAVKAEILDQFRAGDWQPDWIVVTQVAEVGTGTLLVANSANSKIEISGKADFGPGDLARGELGLRARFQHDMAFSDVAAQGLTPICMGMRLKRIWWTPWRRRFQPAVVTEEGVGTEPFSLDGVTSDDFDDV